MLVSQERHQLRGLSQEVLPFLARHQVTDIKSYSKAEWKRFVKRNLKNENRDFLIQWSEKYKKVDSLSLACEDFERKDYFNQLNLAQSRLKFRERSKCMTTCKVDYPSDRDNVKSMFVCNHCTEIDFLSHWRECPHYSEFRKSKSLDNDVDLVNYYQQIINLRKLELYS